MNLAEPNDDFSDLVENYKLQLSEIEMLSSMYPQEQEFKLTTPSVLVDINNFIEEKTKQIPNEVDYILNLEVPDFQDKLEVNIILPYNYPSVKPVAYARSNGLNRDQQKELNLALSDFIKTQPDDELCSLSLIDWLNENSKSYFTIPEKQKLSKSVTSIKDVSCRMWIYSHHIYNKFKRKEIVNNAGDLGLTGFSLPGKPGFICIEGFKRDCTEFLQIIKSMTWKKLSLVKEEVGDTDLEIFRKFELFEEISFKVKKGPCKEYHMDMGQFLKYLEEHSCGDMFQELFGIESHIAKEK